MATAVSRGQSLADLLFEREVLPDEKLGEVISSLYGVPFVKLSEKTIVDSVLKIIPYALASKQLVVAFEQTPTSIKVAFNLPNNFELINFLEKKTGLNVEPFYATKKDIKVSLKAYNKDVNTKFNTLLKGAMTNPTKIESLNDAAKILDTLILFAYQNSASDIHIEPHKDVFVVRYRIDGILHAITEMPIQILELLTTRIKVLANMRTDEHRAAQDGRFKIELEKNEITLRVSIVPTYDGEKTVMRLLSSSNQDLNIESLGYSVKNLQIIHNNILNSYGMILITGPTGSGKTTTLYSVLKLLNSSETNIATIEDPIEYRLDGVNQIQVNNAADLTFANGLRSLLRQDPDVIMVGEIRDEETAGVAINAALTGHLVLATLHTNDVSSTLPRLTDMGIEPFLVSSTVKMIVAQRLVRNLCSKCKQAYSLSIAQLSALGQKFNMHSDLGEFFTRVKNQQEYVFYKAVGCGFCGGTGYKGRTTIAEVMEVSDEIKKLIFAKASAKEIEDMARKQGMVLMLEDGLLKCMTGITSIEEVLRVMRS
ncbi:type II secretion system protein GspE [Candidatus Peregrinibacteria bacterium CG10_big_fil_rev_8_21_14_0_10_36_19]|nr:MAG: type II secretion system protein GspE [Candidatus Peregrinibacteria bacterium CG10_big_fil_rev_8_21_14_0_10_36_19]